MLARSCRRTGGRSVSCLGIVVATAAVLLAVSLTAPAAASPSDQPGGTSGVLDSQALDDLQRRAADVQAGLKQQQGQVEAARRAQQKAEKAVEAARKVLTDRQGEMANYRRPVADYASAVYRNGGALTPLTVLLTGGDPADVVSAMGYLEAVDAHAARVIGAAEQRRQAALAEQRRAAAALAEARERADQVAARVQ
jgi:septal ring factor EnvC (AmiA/AmiB activator)